jgi:WD40 repeat protein
MTRRKTILCALIAAMLPLVAQAEHTRFWRQSDYGDFARGTATGVAIRSDGKITAAPRFTSFADSSLSFLWTLRLDPQGRLYAAGGSDAKVLRFDSAGKATTVFESPELAAQAIAFDAKGNLYVGTSPDGKVYKVTPDGAKTVFFDPKAKYIWSLAVDPHGDVFVGTGDQGQIFVVTPDGTGKSFYQSDQRHARALAFDSEGNLLVGTEPDGLILRIPIVRKSASAAPEPGSPFVLYETSNKEVTSLLTDSAGNIYAAAIGEKTHTANAPVAPVPSQTTTIQVTASASASAPSAQVTPNTEAQPQTVVVQPNIPASFLGASATGAQVVKIAPDDSPEQLWSSRDQIVLSLALSPDGKLLLGTGNRGDIVRLEGNGVYSDIEQTSAMQVTSLIPGPDGKIYAATANPGKIFEIGPGSQPDGNFVSSTYDASIFSHWGRLTWWGEDGGAQGRVEFYVRSGNTSNPEKNWSPWSGPYRSASGETVTCPPARFVQWKAVFLQGEDSAQPSISWVSLAYQPKNVAPVIDAIALQDPGVRVSGFAQQVGGNSAPAQLRIPSAGGAESSSQGNDDEGPGQGRVQILPQASADHGYQSVLWNAHDDNDDTLTYSIYIRGEGEKNWRLLKDKISEQYYSWDTSTMPDGAYYLKIVASDAPSNPPDEALTAERESDRFLVGNTPPRVDDLRAQTDGQAATLSFGATSTSGAIARASYSVDSQNWEIVFPIGQLTDAPKEDYRWKVESLSPGEHTVSVRVTDRFGNETAAKTTFTIGSSTTATISAAR